MKTIPPYFAKVKYILSPHLSGIKVEKADVSHVNISRYKELKTYNSSHELINDRRPYAGKQEILGNDSLEFPLSTLNGVYVIELT